MAASHALRVAAAVLAAASTLAVPAARASEFAVSPVRAELKPGALSETITVTNSGTTRMRLAVRVMAWTQDAQGQDVYTQTGDLVYFPRQMDLEPGAKRLVRVGAKAPATGTERSYRMFIEEQPDPSAAPARAQVAVYFRFGVPVFLRPAAVRTDLVISEPVLQRGKLSLQVRNEGNVHARLLRLKVEDGSGFSREVPAWYLLPGAQRTYTVDIPPQVCRRARALSAAVEGEQGLRADRTLHVDPARCA